ncbi:hypothetical protein ABBQ38_003663 [Trebouxia sp. C0009 RCD-2024]
MGEYNRGGLECEGVGLKLLLLLLPTEEEVGGIAVLDAGPMAGKLAPRGDCEEEAAVSAEDETPAGIAKRDEDDGDRGGVASGGGGPADEEACSAPASEEEAPAGRDDEEEGAELPEPPAAGLPVM